MPWIPKRSPYSAVRPRCLPHYKCPVAALLACIYGATLTAQTNMGTITGLVSDKPKRFCRGSL